MKRNPTDVILVVCLAGAGVAVALGSIWIAISSFRSDQRSLQEAAAIRTQMRIGEATRGPAAGGSSADSLVEKELAEAVNDLAKVDADDRMPVQERRILLTSAFATFDAHLKFKPDDVLTLYRRGRCADLLGRLPEALVDYERAVRLEPKLAKDLDSRIRELRQVTGK